MLKRKIEPGQTVAAAFETPVLFTIAEDLAQMELHVKVDEADIGQVQEGQSATFTVDAYPTRKFPAQIRRVGFGSQTTDGVVSYKTILTVNNDDLSLRPGMTATAEITTATREGVLLVPNEALRFTPQHGTRPPANRAASSPACCRTHRSTHARNCHRLAKRWAAGVDPSQRGAAPATVAIGCHRRPLHRNVGAPGGGLEAGMQVITDVVTATN